jgi:hypothetical protein
VSGRWATARTRAAKSKRSGVATARIAARFRSGIPRWWFTRRRTSAIIRARGMPAGQTTSQALHWAQSDWGPAAASSPWWKAVKMSPIGPV